MMNILINRLEKYRDDKIQNSTTVWQDYGTLRVLNQEVLAPNSEFKAKTYPHVDVVNLILRGEATYLDNMGRTLTAKQNECLLI